jgi:glycosyltransferase involved in cell wall biosynthesis
VHLHYAVTDAPWGGANSFARSLGLWLESQGVRLTRWGPASDVFLINGPYRAPGKLVDRAALESLRRWGPARRWPARVLGARRRPRLVLRVDGLRDHYAGGRSAMDELQLALLPLADRIVFQSRYSLEVFRAAGYSGDGHAVIHNGVDGALFKPAEGPVWDGGRPLRLLASSWSENAGKGHAEVAAFARLPGVEVRFVGRWPKDLPSDGVRLEPPMRHAQLAEAYRWADAFLFPSRREACPNAALEALASGLPVLYHAEGGTAELVDGCGAALSGEPAADLEALRARLPELRARVRAERPRFVIARAGADYLRLFEELHEAR